jgi:hypothetical protein
VERFHGLGQPSPPKVYERQGGRMLRVDKVDPRVENEPHTTRSACLCSYHGVSPKNSILYGCSCLVVARWLHEHSASNTSELPLKEGLNANAAVHDDSICRPVYDVASGKLLQRCVSCAHLGTNTENARMSLALHRRCVDQMERYILLSLQGSPSGPDCRQQGAPKGAMGSELVQHLKVSLHSRKRARLSGTQTQHAEDHDHQDPPCQESQDSIKIGVQAHSTEICCP